MSPLTMVLSQDFIQREANLRLESEWTELVLEALRSQDASLEAIVGIPSFREL